MLETEWIRTLSEQFAGRFPAGDAEWRTLGREAEYPVVREDGSAADVPALLEALAAPGDLAQKREPTGLLVQLDGERYSYALEVGHGTIEVITAPVRDLHAMRALHEEAVQRVAAAASELGFAVLGFGIQPLTGPTAALMSPKQRYQTLLDVLGDVWLWFALTASDQVHVDIRRHEVAPLANLANVLAPLTVGLCGNSSIFAGEDAGMCSAREGGMGTIHAGDFRHGMPAGPVADIDDMVARLARQAFLMQRVDGKLVPYGGTFLQYLADIGGTEAPGAFDAFLLHEHYIWNSARPRSAQATLELRAACQQPWHEHMAAAALNVGMVEGAPEIARYLDETFGADLWPAMRAWHKLVIRDGLAAPEPAPNLVAELLVRCAGALERRGLGEDRYLDPVFSRLERRSNPGQDARDTFADAGIEGLVADRRIDAG